MFYAYVYYIVPLYVLWIVLSFFGPLLFLVYEMIWKLPSEGAEI